MDNLKRNYKIIFSQIEHIISRSVDHWKRDDLAVLWGIVSGPHSGLLCKSVPISYSPRPKAVKNLILAEIRCRESVQLAQNAKI